MSDLNAWGAKPVFCKRRQRTAGAHGCIAHWLPNATAPESLQETGMHSLSLCWRMLVLMVRPVLKALLSVSACLIRNLRR
jgi:hypothetical protein